MPVVPEHNSPTTDAQIDTAAYQTMLARATAAALDLDVPLAPPLEVLDPDLSAPEVRLHPGESVRISAPTHEAEQAP